MHYVVNWIFKILFIVALTYVIASKYIKILKDKIDKVYIRLIR